jgi:amino acid adenylation domain-containing protein
MTQGFRLSPQQKHLWRTQKDLFTKRAQLSVVMCGTVRLDDMQHSLVEVIRKHESFETTFKLVEGMVYPVQVLSELKITWNKDSIERYQDIGFESGLAEKILKEIKCSANSLDTNHSEIQVDVFSFAKNNHLFIIHFNPLAIDSSSMRLITKQWHESCLASFEGENIIQAEDGLSYIEASEWVNDLLESEDSEEGVRFWKQSGFDKNYQLTSLLENKAKHKKRKVESTRIISLSKATISELISMSASNLAGLNELLLACWNILLFRYTQEHQLVTGVVFNGRTDDELETVVGQLERVLPVATNFSDNLAISSILSSLHDVIENADVWQECFSWENVELDNYEKDTYFPYCFEMNMDENFVNSDALTTKILSMSSLTDDFNIKLCINYNNEMQELAFYLKYDNAVICQANAEAMVEQYLCLLSSILDNPEVAVDKLNILPKSQLDTIINEFNNTEKNYQHNICVHQVFESQIRKTPNAPALEFEGKTLSYANVGYRVNNLVDVLLSSGLVSGGFVGVFANRSFDSVIGILAILKAGGVYVPLDPSYPKDRIDYILEDSKTNIILTQNKFSDTRFNQDTSIIFMDEVQTSKSHASLLPSIVKNTDSAYLIYTSGSTGLPKGTLISHSALTNHCFGIQEHYELTSEDRVLLFAPFNFDPSLEQCLPALMTGATVVIREEAAWSITQVAKHIASARLTVVNFPTAYWHLLVQEWENNPELVKEIDCLRLMICGGDKMLLELVERWHQLGLNKVRLLNAYGPTEATVTTTTAELTSRDEWPFGDIPIGRPLANRKLYILNEFLQPVPVGCSGELYIGGMSLATEYHAREALTKEKFVVDPFTKGSRMYRTGDRAFYSESGEIYFLGRYDAQIKINGFRIELTEIESVISQIEEVVESAVAARSIEENDLNKQLIAFYVSTNNEDIKNTIEEHIKNTLPPYMIPREIVLLESLPLLPNGKLDRKSIQELASNHNVEQHNFVSPKTHTEITLAEIWTRLFSLEKVGLNDNFFTLGGHSLVAMKLISEIRQSFNVDLSLKNVFDSQNLAALSLIIDERATETQLEIPPLISVKRQQSLPLSYNQERFWFLSQLGYSAQYHMAGIVTIKGAVDKNILDKTINRMIARHESLRSYFVQSDGVASQVITNELEVFAEYVEHQEDETSEGNNGLDLILQRWIERPFNLESAPLIRIILVRLEDNNYVLGFCIHHIISDGLSIGILIREVSEYYAKLSNNPEYVVPKLSIQYPDYAVWQRMCLTDQYIAQELDYWKRELTGFKNLELNTDRPRPRRLSGKGSSIKIDFGREKSIGLHQFSQKHGVTLFTILITSVYKVLSCYSNQKDICLGTPVANRPDAKLQDLVGLFVNTLVLRIIESSSNVSLHEFLRQVQDTIVTAQDHQSLPFEKIVEALQPERDFSRNPIFQVLVSHIHPERELIFGDSTCEPYTLDYTTSRFDLTFDFEEEQDGNLSLILEYSSDLFDKVTVQKMATHLTQFMSNMLLTKHEGFSEIAVISEAEKQDLLVSGRGKSNLINETAYSELTIQALVAEQVRKHPNKKAIYCENLALTFAELDIQSDILANKLMERGVGSGHLIGICVKRSINMVVVLLGILKSGAAYIPLDPEYPVNRLKYIVDDSQLSLILTQSELQPLVESLLSSVGKYLLIENVLAESNREGFHEKKWQHPEINNTQLAYVMYTSGSSGHPKGVMISHKSVVNFLLSMATKPGFDENDKLLSVTTYCFDISVLELFLPLICGGESYICDSQSSRNGERLIADIARIKPTIMQATPATWNILFHLGWKNTEQVTILCGGEPLPPTLKNYFDETSSKVFNMYGPTETTVWSTLHLLQKEQPVAIGHPIDNTEIYILDESLNIVPKGVEGDLYIGGLGLADGYLNKPDLTEKVFINNPFNNKQNIYKTGDLARWLTDINGEAYLDYRGRADFQVKFRGYRIELGEIEAILSRYPEIKESCVVLKNNQSSPQLVAYLTVNKRAVEIDAIREWVRTFLPEYMIPSNYILLDDMPQTPNGKVARKMLSDKKLEGVVFDEKSRVAPTTKTEKELAHIWCDLLNVEKLDLRDNFFVQGGHSLLVVMLQSRISEEFGSLLELDALFDCNNLKDMAVLVERNVNNSVVSDSQIVAMKATQAPLSFTQQGLWLIEQIEGGTSAYNMPSAIRLKGLIDLNSLINSFSEIQQRHQVLRTTFKFENGESVQLVKQHQPMNIPIVDLSHMDNFQQEDRLKKLAEDDFSFQFDLEHGPLWRVRIIQYSIEEIIVLINMHHITTDGWSLRVLINEMKVLYGYFAHQKPHGLAELEVQYCDFASWQREHYQLGHFQQDITYWKNTLKHAPEKSALPRDYEHTDVQTFNGKKRNLKVSSEMSEKLRQLAQQQDATLYMTMLTAYNILLSIETDECDIVVGTDVANRHQKSLESVVGFFVNQLAVRTIVNHESSVNELISEVRNVCISSFSHQKIPFELLVKSLSIPRSTQYPPIFQTKFIMEKIPEDTYNTTFMELEILEVEKQAARMELTLGLLDTAKGITGSIVYNTDLFKPTTVERIANRFEKLIELMVLWPEAKIKRIKELLLSFEIEINSEEQKDLLEKRMSTFKPTNRRKSVKS